MRRTLCALSLAALSIVMSGPVHAESAADARAAAARAAAAVDGLKPQLAVALAAYDQALADLSAGTTRAISASQLADEADRLREQVRVEHGRRVRALYASGGDLALFASVLEANSPTDLLDRLDRVTRVVELDSGRLQDVEAAHQAAVVAADSARENAAVQIATAGQVEQAYAEVERVLAAAEAELAQLSARAKQLEEAEAAAAAVAAARAQVTSTGNSRAESAQASGVPVDYFALYRAAAQTCPGLPWNVLAAIGQVETGHGRNTNTSSAGAQGPMQFLPSTFRAYGTDGDGDGRADIRNPADAIYSAAKYLCRNGGGNPAMLRSAIWNYNHAEWYVNMVLRIAAQLEAAPPG